MPMDAMGLADTELSLSGMSVGGIDEAALAELDAAAATKSLDDNLLRIAPARDMRGKIDEVVSLLEKMNPEALLRKQGPISKLTGADVEARLEFELASEKVLVATRQLKIAAQNGKRMHATLQAAVREIEADQIRLEAVIVAGRARLADAPGADDFMRSRYERRLANIIAMHTANRLTVEQMRLAETVLATLLDRFTDVETLLLPVWQRSVLAFANSAGSAKRQAGREFSDANGSLITFLKQDAPQ